MHKQTLMVYEERIQELMTENKEIRELYNDLNQRINV